MTDHDPINHPSHYTAYEGLEVIDLTEQLNFNRGNAVKYIARAGLKDPATELEDLAKAHWYIERELARVEKQQAKTANVSEGDGAVERASDSGLMPSDEALATLREKLTSPATDVEPIPYPDHLLPVRTN